jgi:hypothetical protein
VKYNLILLLLAAIPCWGQTTATGKADTKGNCSPAVTGSNNQFSIICKGIGEAQGGELLKIVNKILANQLDPSAVISKLDEIIANQKKESEVVERIQQQSWRKLTDQEISDAASALTPFAGSKVSIVITNPDRDRMAIAQQLGTILKNAQWIFGGINTEVGFFDPKATEFPYGMRLHVREVTPAAQALGNVLISLFGRSNVPDGFRDEKFQKDEIELNIWPTAK